MSSSSSGEALCTQFLPSWKLAERRLALAEAFGKTVEIQCWGYTLTQAANLQVMLAYNNCKYFEQPSPYPSFEYGSFDVIRTDKEGYVNAPPGNGLGIGIDWDAIKRATILNFEISA